jgi:hypothetical protein
MPYVLPVVIDNRRVHYLLATQEALRNPEPFIAALHPGDTPLIYFDLNKAAKVLDDPGKSDIPLRDSEISVALDAAAATLDIRIRKSAAGAAGLNDEEDEEDSYHVSPASGTQYAWPVSEAERQIGVIAGVGLQLCLEESRVVVKARKGNESRLPDCVLTCNIVIDDAEGSNYSCGLVLQLAAATQLLQGALDFGSEASQLMRSRTEETGGGMLSTEEFIVPLFQLMKEACCPEETGDFFQQEGKDNNLFKSVFFVRKKLQAGAGYKPNQTFLPDEEHNLKIVLKEDELDKIVLDYHQLPNLKLLTKHGKAMEGLSFRAETPGGPLRTIPLSHVLRQAYASILKKMISAWLHHELAFVDEPLYVRLTLLVPNVYNEADVGRTVEALHEIFRYLKEDPFLGKSLAGWEVLTVSESDAAFLGYYLKKAIPNPQANDYYVIIDCGKGTTDFSIMQRTMGAAETLQTIYRSGIAGAGNLISYAFFLAMLKYISEANERAEHARAFGGALVDAGEHLKLKLWRIIERLKHQYKIPASDAELREIVVLWSSLSYGAGGTRRRISDLNGTDVVADVVNELFRKVEGIPDEHDFIGKICDKIVTAVIRNIIRITGNLSDRGMKCKGVFLTGRAFLFIPLLNRLKTALGGALAIDQRLIRTPDKAEYKTIAVEGVLKSPFLIQPQMIGWPVQIPWKEENMPDEHRDSKPSARRSYITDWMNENLKISSVGKAKNINPLSKITEDFSTHRLLIDNKVWWPRDKAFHNRIKGKGYDLVFHPTAADETRFMLRLLTHERDGLLESMIHLGISATLQDGMDDMIIPSLFPVMVDTIKDELLNKVMTT